MSFNYGPAGLIVTTEYINSLNTTGATVLSQSYDTDNGYTVTIQHDLAGCGGAETGFFIEIKDPFPWRNMSCRFRLLGGAACWSFMNTGGSNYGTAAGSSGTGYMLSYSEAAGDRIIRTYLAQDDPQFATHDKVFACDNDTNNFMRYNTGEYRSFTMVRRRNVNGSLAGVHHGRSCNSTGGGSITIVDQIRIW